MTIRGSSAGYEIQRATGVCASSGRAIGVGEVYIATLSETADGFTRNDYAMEAWEGGARPAGAMLGFWRARMSAGAGPRRGLIAGDEVMDLFEQLEGTEDPSRQAFRYVLALILIRKKMLQYEGTREGVMFVRLRGGAEEMRVVDPGMDAARIAEVGQQIGQILIEDES